MKKIPLILLIILSIFSTRNVNAQSSIGLGQTFREIALPRIQHVFSGEYISLRSGAMSIIGREILPPLTGIAGFSMRTNPLSFTKASDKSIGGSGTLFRMDAYSAQRLVDNIGMGGKVAHYYGQNITGIWYDDQALSRAISKLFQFLTTTHGEVENDFKLRVYTALIELVASMPKFIMQKHKSITIVDQSTPSAGLTGYIQPAFYFLRELERMTDIGSTTFDHSTLKGMEYLIGKMGVDYTLADMMEIYSKPGYMRVIQNIEETLIQVLHSAYLAYFRNREFYSEHYSDKIDNRMIETIISYANILFRTGSLKRESLNEILSDPLSWIKRYFNRENVLLPYGVIVIKGKNVSGGGIIESSID